MKSMLSNLVSSTNNSILNNSTNATIFTKKALKSTKTGLTALEKNFNSTNGMSKKHNTQLNGKIEVIYFFFSELFL